jgi:hypothetical protein
MHVFKHPKYYEEFRQRSKRAQLNKKNNPSLKQQATSVKPQAASDKPQAASSKQQASSLKPKV